MKALLIGFLMVPLAVVAACGTDDTATPAPVISVTATTLSIQPSPLPTVTLEQTPTPVPVTRPAPTAAPTGAPAESPTPTGVPTATPPPMPTAAPSPNPGPTAIPTAVPSPTRRYVRPTGYDIFAPGGQQGDCESDPEPVFTSHITDLSKISWLTRAGTTYNEMR